MVEKNHFWLLGRENTKTSPHKEVQKKECNKKSKPPEIITSRASSHLISQSLRAPEGRSTVPKAWGWLWNTGKTAAKAQGRHPHTVWACALAWFCKCLIFEFLCTIGYQMMAVHFAKESLPCGTESLLLNEHYLQTLKLHTYQGFYMNSSV